MTAAHSKGTGWWLGGSREQGPLTSSFQVPEALPQQTASLKKMLWVPADRPYGSWEPLTHALSLPPTLALTVKLRSHLDFGSRRDMEIIVFALLI